MERKGGGKSFVGSIAGKKAEKNKKKKKERGKGKKNLTHVKGKRGMTGSGNRWGKKKARDSLERGREATPDQTRQKKGKKERRIKS